MLDDEQDDEEKVREQVRAQLNAADERIVENPDGTFIVKLVEPIKVADTEHTRVTIERLRVRDIREARHAPDRIEAYAERLCRPAGAFDELVRDDDYAAVCRAVERALGKYRAAGSRS